MNVLWFLRQLCVHDECTMWENEVAMNRVEWIWNRALSCQSVGFYTGMDFTRCEMRFARRRLFENKQTILSAAFSEIRMSFVWILWDDAIDASEITNIKSRRWRWLQNNEGNSLTSSQHRVFHLRISLQSLCDVLCLLLQRDRECHLHWRKNEIEKWQRKVLLLEFPFICLHVKLNIWIVIVVETEAHIAVEWKWVLVSKLLALDYVICRSEKKTKQFKFTNWAHDGAGDFLLSI